MYVKICGLRTAEAAEAAVRAGADAIGVVMSPASSRHADADEARTVVSVGREAGVTTVLVANDLPAAEAARRAVDLGFDALQLHGPAYGLSDFEAAQDAALIQAAAEEGLGLRLWRATSLKHDPAPVTGSHGEDVLLLDAPKPGGGATWDLSALTAVRPQGHWLLAGGLDPDNVAAAIATADPWGVDVSSGVESAPGVKDLGRIAAFVAAARGAQNSS